MANLNYKNQNPFPLRIRSSTSLPATIGNVKNLQGLPLRLLQAEVLVNSQESGVAPGTLAVIRDLQREHARSGQASPWLGHQFPAEPFSSRLTAPAHRLSRRGGGGDHRSLRLADGSRTLESGQKPASPTGSLQ